VNGKMLLIAFLILLSASSFAEVKRYEVPIGDSPQLGPRDARITMIEFLDFQ
jgi:hypothetical protein